MASNTAKPATQSGEGPWYKDGLKFKCTGCGDCCTGAPGYVWLNKADIAALAKETEVPTDEFLDRFTRPVGVRRSLIEHENGDCVFFDNQTRKCQVYGARPRQCRTWPFWDSNLKSSEAWDETCEVCPGSGKGKLYSIEQIDQQRSVVRV
ncbi:MAG: YkgJ family cysteine cluster protein [Planctomycetota bacterium]